MRPPNRISRLMTSVIALVCVFHASGIRAQQDGWSVASDLNNDGRVERFYLEDTSHGTVTLRIENTGGGVIYADDIAWSGGVGRVPILDVAPNGSVLLTSKNEGVGRTRWFRTLTIAYRDGSYVVAGFTYDWYDTLDLDAYGTCDVNFLTGRAKLERNGVPSEVQTSPQKFAVTEWTEGIPMPAICKGAL